MEIEGRWQCALDTCDRCGDQARCHRVAGPAGELDGSYCDGCLYDALDALAATAAGERCRICGCSDAEACEEGCSWSENPGVCSACQRRIDAVLAWALPRPPGWAVAELYELLERLWPEQATRDDEEPGE